MSVVHNERVKLSATALNNTAVATVITGFVAPLIAVLYGLPTVPTFRLWWLVALAWLLAGIGLHTAARMLLGNLKS